jgi:hypothetical protein
MKNLSEFILEAVRKQINIDDIDNNELKKFAKNVATHVNANYHLDYGFDVNFIFDALLKLKDKNLKLSVNDFHIYETNGDEYLYCSQIEQYYDSNPKKGWLDI